VTAAASVLNFKNQYTKRMASDGDGVGDGTTRDSDNANRGFSNDLNNNKMGQSLIFAEIFLDYGARALVCGKGTMCAKPQSISEYELYFQYARVFFPDTVSLRPLLWANGPKPGLLFWPDEKSHMSIMQRLKRWWNQGDKTQLKGLSNDNFFKMRDYYDVRDKLNWLLPTIFPGDQKWVDAGGGEIHRNTVSSLEHSQQLFFNLQMMVDKAQGYHYIAYHGHADSRGFELTVGDIEELCSLERLKWKKTSSSKKSSRIIESHIDSEIVDDEDLADRFDNYESCSMRGRIDSPMEFHSEISPKTFPALFRGCACYDLQQVAYRRKNNRS
jgi:hypothetical protein